MFRNVENLTKNDKKKIREDFTINGIACKDTIKSLPRNKNNKIEYLHTLNGTAAAMSRMMIAIIENHQNDKGELVVPEVLLQYMGGVQTI